MRTNPLLDLKVARAAMSAAALFAAVAVGAPGDSDPGLADALRDAYQANDRATLLRAAQTLEARLAVEPERVELHQALGMLYLDKLEAAEKAVPQLEKVVDQLPNDAGWQLAYGRALRAGGRSQEAVRIFLKAAQLPSGDGWAYYELGNTLAADGKYRDAETAYRAALSAGSKSAPVRVALAKTLWAAGRVPEAQQIAAAVLQEEPGNEDAARLAAPTDPPVAATEKKNAAPAMPRLSPVDRAVTTAYTSRRKADYVRAAELLEAALQREPRDLARRKTIADIYLEKIAAPARAVPHLERVVAASPRDGGWWQMLGKAHQAAGDHASAAFAYGKAAQLSPRDPWSRYHRGRALLALGQKEAAASAFEEALTVDPRNRYARMELARLHLDAERADDAATIARDLVREDARDPEAQVLLGDVLRHDRDLRGAMQAYQTALGVNTDHAPARSGLDEVRREQRAQAKLAFYTFEDTDDFRQSGAFGYASAQLTSRLRASAFANELFFKRGSLETLDRFEAGVGLDYQLSRRLQISGSVTQFTTEGRGPRVGGNFAVYFTPSRRFDGWVAYRAGDPVNDSYLTVRDAFTQRGFSGGLNYRFTPRVIASLTASQATYSDGNDRNAALASLAWYLPWTFSPVVKLEYEWLDFERHVPGYSSPSDYGRLRPVVEFAVPLTEQLKFDVRGELSYVFDEAEWGHGLLLGPRYQSGEAFEAALSYMKYDIPGGQTTWSGEGVKLDLAWRF